MRFCFFKSEMLSMCDDPQFHGMDGSSLIPSVCITGSVLSVCSRLGETEIRDKLLMRASQGLIEMPVKWITELRGSPMKVYRQ